MTANLYQHLANRTAPQDSKPINGRFVVPMEHLVHAQLGLTTEVGEFSDSIKKHLIYGRALDLVNLEEELGDILWYVALAVTALGGDMESIMTSNIEKLRIRYPEKFTEQDALERKDKKDWDYQDTQQ